MNLREQKQRIWEEVAEYKRRAEIAEAALGKVGEQDHVIECIDNFVWGVINSKAFAYAIAEHEWEEARK